MIKKPWKKLIMLNEVFDILLRWETREVYINYV